MPYGLNGLSAFGVGVRPKGVTQGGVTPGTTIPALARNVWGYGSSSMEGTGQVNWNITKKMAALADPSYTIATEQFGSVTYTNRKYTATNGKVVHNHGVNGDTIAMVTTRFNNESSNFAADDFFILHVGDNDGGVDSAAELTTVKTGLAALRASISSVGPFLMCVNTRGSWNGTSAYSEAPGSATYYNKELLFDLHSEDTPGRVIDFFYALMDNYTAVDANDTTDMNRLNSPRSAMMTNGSHMNDNGYETVGQEVAHVREAIDGGTPYPLRQRITPQAPSTPAINDSIGSIVFYSAWDNATNTYAAVSSGVDLAPSNVQSDYDVSASGLITRKTAIVPARDLTEVHVRTRKSGYVDKVQKRILVGERAAAGESFLVEFDGASILYAAYAGQLTSTATGLIIFRAQATAAGVGLQNRIAPGITMQTTGGMNVTLGSDASGNVFNADFSTNVWTSGGAPTAARWVMMAWDIPNGIAKVRHFVNPSVTPTSVTNSTAHIVANPGAKANLAGSIRGFGHGTFPVGSGTPGALVGRFRLGDFAVFGSYWDPDVQANREKFALAGASSATPASAWLASSDGSVDGVVPQELWRGRATDFRRGINLGSASLRLAFNSWLLSGMTERGYLKTV